MQEILIQCIRNTAKLNILETCIGGLEKPSNKNYDSEDLMDYKHTDTP